MSSATLLDSNTTIPKSPFSEMVRANSGANCSQKKAAAKETLQGALHTVQLRVHQLVVASFKAHKNKKSSAISHQLHELSAYQGLLHQLSDSLASGSSEVCLNSFMTTVSHVTSRIQHSLHDYPHEEGHHDEHPFTQTSFLHGLEHQNTHLNGLINYGNMLHFHARELKKASVDFDVTIMTAAAIEAGSLEKRNDAKEALKEAVTKELVAEGIVAAATVETPEADDRIHKTAKKRWQEIKAEAAKIHEAAKTHGSSMRAAISDLYKRKLQPHVDAWRHCTAERVPEEFAYSVESMNYFIEGLNKAVASFPSKEVQTLQAFHDNVSSTHKHCDSCINLLGETLDALKTQKAAIDEALKAAKNFSHGDVPNANLAAMMRKPIAPMQAGHEEHLPPEMNEVTNWLNEALGPLQNALKALGISKESGKGITGNAYTA